MALIESMKIVGIRSFGPDHPQKIEFFTPVTLILGTNGTGKTVSCSSALCPRVTYEVMGIYETDIIFL